MTAASRAPRQIRGKHVLLALFAFFGVMFAANGIFVYFALTTFNGVETDAAYRKGLAYNERLAEAERQAERQWKAKLGVTTARRSLTFSLEDHGGFPVSGLMVDADISRPATDKFDRRLELEETKPGLYSSSLADAPHGAWTVAIAARRETPTGPRVVYRLKERIWLVPKK